MKNQDNKRKRYLIIGIYFFMLAGGLWQALNVLQRIRELMAAPLLILLAVWLIFETGSALTGRTEGNARLFVFLAWTLGVIVLGFMIEWLGVKSGAIFGGYQYGAVLRPQIDDVPVAIGFAWFISVMGSMAAAQWWLAVRADKKGVFIVVAAAFMVLFDLLLEMAAVKLGYWSWHNGGVPLQNYIAWFVIGGFFIFWAYVAGVVKEKLPFLAVHLFLAQLIYFSMVAIS
ncbi:carotenoid biosynthesis protein [candidate division KSB1 bacterium]|nr:carotenoid biosynthesis protein [candidate division KSB1 bacterium]